MSNPNKLNGGQDMAEEAARAAQGFGTQANSPTDRAAGQAHRVIDKAQARADEVTGQVQAKASELVDQTNAQLNQALSSAGQQLHGVARQVRQIPAPGQVSELVGRAADVIDRSGAYLERADPDTMRSDLEQLIRKHPLPALAVGIGIGYLLGRGFR